ncbi:JNK1/MAPK8-associated membrane protein isoform X2 [Anabrus simplex]|uniref:JNK1/MAPK8-associated membrane protein isoform X2 n=1 Tax=Anabrus simplex TaxID=316456 RepID=UPI0035A36790
MRRETFMYLCSYAVMVSSEIEGGALLGGLSPCPGLYCGRQLLSDGNWSECSSCPRGYRANSSSACVECSDSPVFYDWLYLGFMALLALVLHWFCIDIAARRRSFCREVLVLHISAVFEIVTAAALTLLLSEPVGTLNVRSCHVKKLSDWYTLLHNPNPNYEETLHCTQEAVYPLYTMVFIFYALSVLLMLIVRPWLAQHFLPRYGKMSIYAALYFFPTLALIQAIFGGLIYYSFPYIIIVLSVFSNAAHFAFKDDQDNYRGNTYLYTCQPSGSPLQHFLEGRKEGVSKGAREHMTAFHLVSP